MDQGEHRPDRHVAVRRLDRLADWSYTDSLRPEPISQGDVFDNFEFLVPLPGGFYKETGRVIVVSHNCDCDKASGTDPLRPITIAPLQRLDDLPDGKGGHARHGQMWRYWALAPVQDPEAEYGVDWSLMQPTLADALVDGNRILSMDDDGQLLLADRASRMLTQRELK